MVLYDIHTHLQSFSKINGYDIEYILNTYPFDFEEVKKKQPLARYFSCGIHPWYSENHETQFHLLKKIVQSNSNIVAIGEIGLDKVKGLDIDTQMQIFRMQAQLSEEVNKPVIIHCVKAWDELIALKRELDPRQPWIIHGYRGGLEQTKQLLKFGFYFSIGELYNTETIKEIPPAALFLETDMSDISVFTIYHNVASDMGVNMTELIDIVGKNVSNTFIL